MEEDLDDVKSRIFAILKEKGSLTLHKLVTEYERQTEATFPFKQFCCRSPLGFIRTLTDLVIFADEKISLTPGAYSRFLPSESEQDGDNLGRPDSTADNLDQKSTLGDQKLRDFRSDLMRKMESILYKNPGGISPVHFLEAFKAEFGRELDVSHFGHRSFSDLVTSDGQNIFYLAKDKNDELTLCSRRLRESLDEQTVNGSNKMGRGCHNESSVRLWKKKYLSYEIDNKFERLAKKHPNGILEEEFCSMYEREYGPLNPTAFGFPSVFRMLLSSYYIEVARIDERFVIFPKIVHQRESCPPLLHEPLMIPMERMSLLWSEFFDPCECDPLFKYTSPEVPVNWAAVEIIDAYSPTDFWIRTKENEDRVNKLMNELNEYYEDENNSASHDLPERFSVHPGLAVVGYHMDEWHRAVIKSVSGVKMELFFVDYGTTVPNMKRSQVKKLLRIFAEVEMIALKAKLWNVRPNGEVEWPVESFTYIYHEWGYITLRMKIIKVDHSDPEVPEIEGMFFSDKSSKYFNNFTRWYPDRVFNLSELLVEEKIGVWIDAPDPKELFRDHETACIIQHQAVEEVQEGSSINQVIDKPLGKIPSQLVDEPFVPCEDLSKFTPECLGQFSGRFPIPNDGNMLAPIFLREKVILDVAAPEPQKMAARIDAPTTHSPTESRYSSKPREEQNQMTSKVVQSIIGEKQINSGVINFLAGETIMKLLVIMEKDLCLVLKEKLFSATGMDPEVAQHRFAQAGLNILEVHVNNRNNRKLWEFIQEYERNKGVYNKDREYVLVPLEDAAKICTAIHPHGQYAVVFD